MGMEVITVYDTTEKVESKTTPDLLAQLLLEYVPQSNSWVSVPDEDDPIGANWTPNWFDIHGAVAELERFLTSEAAGQMTVNGFTTEELIDELRLLSDELRAASKHTSRFHLCVY
jgi:hypothetical protein